MLGGVRTWDVAAPGMLPIRMRRMLFLNRREGRKRRLGLAGWYYCVRVNPVYKCLGIIWQWFFLLAENGEERVVFVFVFL
jgi:hypothetical protein